MDERAKQRGEYVGEGTLPKEELRASYRHLASILESMLDAVIVANPDGTIRTLNRAALELLGYAEEETIGQPVGIIFEEEEEEEEEEAFFFRGTGLARLVQEGTARDVEMTLLAKSGERIPVLFNGSVIQEEDGRLAGAVGVARDIRELKRAEEERAKAEAEVETARATAEIIKGMPDPLIVLDLNGVILSANPALTKMLGWRPEERVGKRFDELRESLRAEDIERFMKLLGELVETGEVEPVETVIRMKDGSEILTSVAYSLIKDAEGNPKNIVAVLRDITALKRAEKALHRAHDELEIRVEERTAELAKANEELRTEIAGRRRAEEALQESREHYDSIIESIPSSLLTIDRNLRVVSVNRNFLEKARRSESETIGRRIEEVFSPAVLAYSKLEERITEVFRTGRSFGGGEMERLPGLFGRVYFYRVSPLKDERGEVKNAVLLMDDVTEQKRLSEEVRRAERHLVSVVDSANDLVVSMDPEGRILTWNRAAGQTSGFKFREVQSQYLPDLCVEEDQQEMGTWLARLAKGQFTARSMEVSLRTREGKEVPISWACSRMLDDEHRIVGLVAVGRDLTERKRLEAQLIKSAKLTSLGVMAGGIAHEIRNPLAIGSAAAQLLLEGGDDEKLRKEAAEKIYSGIQRASYIIENLLKFARPPEERMAAVDTSEALEETLSLLANQLRVQQIELGKDFASELPLVVGNKSLLQGVFSNLILNACNAMPEGGNLTVATRVNSDNQVEIEFADTGFGIPKDNLSKIFDPFFTTMPVGKGTGLGLSISYSIIKQHHGAIDVESKVGVGSTFTVRLPGAMDEKGDASG